MTLPLAIRPRIRLRDEPERSRAAWAPPMALPVTVYWLVMGFLTYGVSKGPSWFAREEMRLEQTAVETGPVRQLTGAFAARSETPIARSEPPIVREDAPRARDEAPAVRSTLDD